jgi:hypothetical protein
MFQRNIGEYQNKVYDKLIFPKIFPFIRNVGKYDWVGQATDNYITAVRNATWMLDK